MLKKNLPLEAARLEIPIAVAEHLTANLRVRPQYDTNISYPLEVSHKRRTRPRSEGVARTVAEAQFQDTLRNQIDHLCSVFVDLQAEQENVRIAREKHRAWSRTAEAIRARARKGTTSPNELTIGETAYEEAGNQSGMAQEILGRRWHRLGLLIELPDESLYALLKVEPIRPERPIPPLDEVIRLALETRPDLAALRLGLERAQAEVKETSNAVGGSEVYYLYQPYTIQDTPVSAKTGTSWALGVTIPLPIYNRNQGGIQRAKLNVVQSQLQLATMERQIKSQVEQCHRECRATLVEPAARKKETQAASQYRDAARRRYEAGEIGVDEVLKAMRQYEVVERQSAEALVKYRRTTLELNTAVGMRIMP